MDPQAVTEFLEEPAHLVRIGTVDDDGMPLVVPTWFVFDDGRILVTPRERSAWRRHLEREPKVCFTVDEERNPYRKVVVRGEVDVVHPLGEDDRWRDVYRTITGRYLPEAAAEAYLRSTWDEPRALLGLRLDRARVTTWVMPGPDSPDPLAVWAPKYYHRTP